MDTNTKEQKKKRLRILALFTAIYFCAAGLLLWLVWDAWQRQAVTEGGVSRGFATEALQAGDVLTQSFQPGMDFVQEITLDVSHWPQDASAAVEVTLLRGCDTLCQRRLTAADYADGSLRCAIDPPTAARGGELAVAITGADLSLWGGDTIAAGRFDVADQQAGTLTLNGQTLSGRLVMTVRGYNQYHVLRYYWPVALALYAAGLIFLSIQLRRPRSLLVILSQTIKRYKYLLKQLVGRDFRVKYQASVLGVLWSFLNPMLMAFVYYFVFSTIFKSAIDHFIVYLMSGIILFNYFSESTSLSLISVVGNAPLITKVYIPKYIFPVTKALSSAINLAISFIPLFALMLFTGVPFHKSLLLIPLLLFFLIGFAIGVGLILSAMYVFFRDVGFLWSVLISIWNFLTPIFYPVSIIPDKYMPFYQLNPMYQILSFARSIILNGVSPAPQAYLFCLLWSMGTLAVGLAVYYKSQDKFCLYL